MMQFGFRWLSLGKVTEVQSLFPVEHAQDGTRAAPFFSGIARLRQGDTWDENMGIAVAMIHFRDNGRYNRQELRLADNLRKRAAQRLPSGAWGDFYLSLGAFLEVLRIRSEFRIALATEVLRLRHADQCLECSLNPYEDPTANLYENTTAPMQRALLAIQGVVGLPPGLKMVMNGSRKRMSEAAVAESCARRILKATGPFVQAKRLATGISMVDEPASKA